MNKIIARGEYRTENNVSPHSGGFTVNKATWGGYIYLCNTCTKIGRVG